METSGCPEDWGHLPPLPTLQEVCCGVCSRFAGGKGPPQERACGWQTLTQAGETPVSISWGDGFRGARPTASQRLAGCDPKHRRQRVTPVPTPTGDSGWIAEALLFPAPSACTHAFRTETKGKPSGEKELFL